jgi:biotin carboxyl carrier protein
MSKDHQRKKTDPKPADNLEELIIGGAAYQTQITRKFRNRARWERPDKLNVASVIPGTIQRILVAEGQEVAPGDPLLILEAMKMRNEVRSPVAGTVAEINVKEGEQVPKAHLLVRLSEGSADL